MIICCGEALMDMVPQNTEAGEAYLPVPGGAIFNTAIALGRLGEKTALLTGISSDSFGEQLIRSLEESHVATDLCVRSARATTLAFVKLDKGDAQYLFFDENSAGRMLTIDDLPVLPLDTAALHFGAISLIPEPCGASYEALLNQNFRDVVISIDPNIRANFITNAKAHRGRIHRMIEKADIVKVSDDDLIWIREGKSQDSIVNSWLGGGVKIVLITHGAEGVTAITRGGKYFRPAETVIVKDTIGAGDSFNAGFLSSLHHVGLLSKGALEHISESDIIFALDRAAKVAAFTVSQTGAASPFLSQIGAL